MVKTLSSNVFAIVSKLPTTKEALLRKLGTIRLYRSVVSIRSFAASLITTESEFEPRKDFLKKRGSQSQNEWPDLQERKI